jgi:hypothetical protein
MTKEERNMNAQIAGSNDTVSSAASRHDLIRKILLASGIASSLLYVVANDIVAAMSYPGYSRISQPISQLSATFAPSRTVLVPLIVLYELLIFAFGIGVWQSAHGKRLLRVTGGLLSAGGILGLVGLAFPMTQLDLSSDMMHNILMGTVTPLLMFVTIGFGAAALERWFRLYSILTIAVLLLGGALSGMQIAQMTAGETVSWFGLTQRMLTGAWLSWVAVLAIVLIRAQPEQIKT